MILGQKEEPMDVETFIALGQNRIALRGYTEYNPKTGSAMLEIDAWTVPSPEGTFVHVCYSRCVVLKTGRSLNTKAYNLAINFRDSTGALGYADYIIEYAKKNCSHRGFLVRDQVAYTRLTRQFFDPPISKEHTYHHCDPLFAAHLRVMHALCEHTQVKEENRMAMSVFNQRLAALIHENDWMISRGALYPMF